MTGEPPAEPRKGRVRLVAKLLGRVAVALVILAATGRGALALFYAGPRIALAAIAARIFHPPLLH